MIDEVLRCGCCVAVHMERRTDQQESECTGNSKPEVQKAGDAGSLCVVRSMTSGKAALLLLTDISLR